MAFQESRSASDQVFVLRRILDERWRKGCQTIVVSIDLRQAFDTVDVTKLAPILQEMGVSAALINRIVEACLVERTSLQWYGQRTPTMLKAKGIKQGCPLSPRLFILMLHHVLMTLKEFVPEMHFEHVSRILLPCILAYADDLLSLCENEEDVAKLLEILKPLLASVGLQINTAKTKVLYRDPYDINNTNADTEKQFGRYKLTVVTKLRYLGAYITSSLTRKEITAERIKKAKKAFHALCSFLRKFKLNWEVVRRLYHTLITPVVTYSMETSAILKRNRNDLRTMESEMVATLMSLSKDKGQHMTAAPMGSAVATGEHNEGRERQGPEAVNRSIAPQELVDPVMAASDTAEVEHREGRESQGPATENRPFAPQVSGGPVTTGLITAEIEHSEDRESRGPAAEIRTIEGQESGGPDTATSEQVAAVTGRQEHSEEEEPFDPAKILEGHTINNKIRVARLKFYGHVIRNNDGILRTALRYRLPKKKKLGRPAFTWRASIRQDIERSGITTEVWQEWARDKRKMDAETKKLFGTLRESDRDSDSERHEDTEEDMLPSEFEGFSSDESSIFEGVEDQQD